jgi:hypothetical protein
LHELALKTLERDSLPKRIQSLEYNMEKYFETDEEKTKDGDTT